MKLHLFWYSILIFFTISCKTESNSDASILSIRFEKATFTNSKYIEDKPYHICLPKSYTTSPNKNYPVLYMMDGQNLFFDSLSYIGYSWNVQNVLDSLVEKGKVKEAIIVGINNAEARRFSEYMPQKPVEALSQEAQDSLVAFIQHPVFSDNFLQFLTTELKPLIDKNYRTLTDAANTFVGGSSMGGLIAMYAQCEYPNIFGGAICLSTHWPISLDDTTPLFPKELIAYFSENLPKDKIWYFDHGTVGLDQYYEKYQRMVDTILIKNGYQKGQNFISEKFIGHDHNERYWHSRLHLPLTLLLKKN